ncbi:MAG TPA: trypsin-like peptidase domain-containing protein [Pirellulales bacterium]|nr:trypsin-like peptidase domain-containing protein [Pirellulales bacterium]
MSHRHASRFPRTCLVAIGCLAFLFQGGLPSGRGDETRRGESQRRRDPIVLAVNQAKPAIVNIHGEKTVTAEGAATAPGDVGRRVNGMGTGVIIDPRGYVITNHHVVDGVKRISVTTVDHDSYIARLISHDPRTDLAIIKIDSDEPLPVIAVGTSNDLMLAETVVAVGNAFGYEHTVTKGIISALHRTVQVSDAQNYDDLIQTDASINPGNSGGPLLNVDGQMIGLNVAVRAGAQGIGFAIPVDKVMEVAADLLSTRRLNHTWHGVVANMKFDATHCDVVVGAVDVHSPAADCGLKPGDVIKRVDDHPVSRTLDLERALLGHLVGDEIPVEVQRKGQPLELAIVLASAPRSQDDSSDPSWDLLGLALKPMPSKQFRQLHRGRYNGGLTVLDVRSESPAAKQGIRKGDVLVGMHVWETIKMADVVYILERPDFDQLGPLKFYILRENEPVTLYGFLTVARHRK